MTTSNEYVDIPLDEDDYRYHQSFTVNEAKSAGAREFFDRYGFWIFRDVLTEEECREQTQDMDDFLLEHGKGLARFGIPKGVNSLFRPALLKLRQHPRVLQVLGAALRTDDFVVSHDRWLMHVPTKETAQPLTKRNVHIDFNPWEYHDLMPDGGVHDFHPEVMARLESLNYSKTDRAFISENNDIHQSMGRCLQAIVNLSDLTDARCGGTILIPCSHQTLKERFHKNGRGSMAVDNRQYRAGPMQYKFEDSETLALAQHVKLRPGSLLVWDQRVAHGSTPNLHPTQTRRAIPVRAFRRQVLSAQRARERGSAIQRKIQECGFEGRVTKDGRRVFGLDLIE